MPAQALRNLDGSLIVLAIVVAALVLGSDILIPLAIAAILAFILHPIVRLLERARIPRAAAVTAVMLATVMLVAALSFSFSSQLLSLTAGLESYKTNLVGKARVLGGIGRGEGVMRQAGETVSRLGKEISEEIGGAAHQEQPVQPPIPVRTVQPPSDLLLTIADLLGAPLTKAALVLLFALFLLVQHQDLRDRIVRLAGPDNLSDTTAAMSDAGSRLSRLFLAQAGLNAGFGIFVGIALWLIGVPNPLLWGVLTFFMRFVPFVGSFVAAIPPILLAAAVDPGWGTAVATLVVFAAGEPFMGHVAEPLVLGRRAGLSPFAMVAAASFWTLIWGPVGLILAAPITLALVVLGRYIPGLEFFTVLLGDQPALLPEQELYQRALAGDFIAVEHQVEELLEDAGTEKAVDMIVLPALRLAARDHRRGKLDREQIARLAASVEETGTLISELSRREPPRAEEHGRALVLVVPARGPIDVIGAQCVAGCIEAATGAEVTAATHATGLTALADARSTAAERPVDAVVLVTVGGIEQRHLDLVLRRAERDFPDARLLLLGGGSDLSPPPEKPRQSRVAVHGSLVNLTAALAVAPIARPASARLPEQSAAA